jgi:hypothetical protein
MEDNGARVEQVPGAWLKSNMRMRHAVAAVDALVDVHALEQIYRVAKKRWKGMVSPTSALMLSCMPTAQLTLSIQSYNTVVQHLEWLLPSCGHNIVA